MTWRFCSMSPFRLPPLLCAVTLTLVCAACTATPSFSLPEASITEPVAPPPAASSPESTVPDEPSVPVMSTPEPSPVPLPSSGEAEPVNTPTREQDSPDLTPLEPAPPEPSIPDPSDTAPARSEPQQPAPQSDLPELPQPPAAASNYDISQPVPESAAVDMDYFADAAFVGDSRSEGFYLYGVKRGQNLSSSGLSVFNLDEKRIFSLDGTKVNALDVLRANQYQKVYLGFGINELGYINADAFYTAYCDTIDTVRSCQPGAVVYAQTIAPVNENRVSAVGGAGHLNNERVQLYNELIRKAAVEKQIPLLDLYTLFLVDGTLPAEASRDGVHLTGDYCRKQLEYLKTHTVSFDTLYSLPRTETEDIIHEETVIPGPDPLPEPDPDLLHPEAEQPPLPAGAAPGASAG